MAPYKTLLTAILLFSTVAFYDMAAAAAGDGELRGEDHTDSMIRILVGDYALCRTKCVDNQSSCKDWCVKEGYHRGGNCVPAPAAYQQCCCLGPEL
ncbi:hypothetical protein ACP70R_008526 [Stipagrostis hirtigluma subsp. patula]